MFPFQLERKKDENYYGCLTHTDDNDNDDNPTTFSFNWCPAEVDQDRVMVTWGLCGPDCPTHEETLTWSKDETVKVTLHYNNPALRVGMELYGAILLWIFVLGLILTIFTPILGKSCPVHSFS